MRIRSIEIADDVADVLRRSTWQDSTLLLPPGQLDRKLYVAVDKVIGALGGKWNRGAKGHVFAAEASAELIAALDAGGVVDEKKTFEQFFTPETLAKRMAALAGIEEGDHVLEPSCGSGVLVRAALAAGAGCITAIEGHRQLAERMWEEMKGKVAGSAQWADFMEWEPLSPQPIDVVLMNPPFSNGQDMRHVRRAFEFLRPGGHLVAIMSPHFTFADHREAVAFREWIGWPEGMRLGDRTGVELSINASVERLPDGTFSGSGTNVSTVLVTLRRP